MDRLGLHRDWVEKHCLKVYAEAILDQKYTYFGVEIS